MKKNYSIAICDILGFSNLVINSPVETIVDKYVSYLRRALSHSLYKDDFPDEIPSLDYLQQNKTIGVAWFSDTVVLFTKEDTDEHLMDLLSTVGWFVFECMFSERRVRCGIAYGEAYIDTDEDIYVGPPIIEAYKLEQRQAWSGGALAQSVIDRLPRIAMTGETIDWWIVPYGVPKTGGGIVSKYAINWTIGTHPPTYSIDWSRSSLEPSLEERKSKPKIVEKWENTRKFHHDVCMYCSR